MGLHSRFFCQFNILLITLDETLNLMLDRLIANVRYSKYQNIDESFYITYKNDFIHLLNKSEVFSSSTFEILYYQILTTLNNLIEILIGRKVDSISSKTKFFEQKKRAQLS